MALDVVGRSVTKTIVCFFMLLFVTDVWSFSFCPLRSPLGDLVYVTDLPVTSLTGDSLTGCAANCAFAAAPFGANSRCRGFNYNNTSTNCSLYFNDVINSNKTDQSGTALFYQLSSQPLKPLWQTVPSYQCDFPYEYNGQLYHECRYEAPKPNSQCESVGYFGCCLDNGTQAFCVPSAGGTSRLSATAVKYVDVLDCTFPYTFKGRLLYSCMRNVVGVTNDCHPAACMTVDGTNRTMARCKPPSGYVAQVVNSTVQVSGQSDRVVPSVFGWIVFLSRMVGNADGNWNLDWMSYTNGFSFSATCFWLGLERIHQLSVNGNWRLRLEYNNGSWYSAEYWTFTVSDSSTFYTINFVGYSGDDGDILSGAGDIRRNANTMRFTTKDKDYDNNADENCAQLYAGGWWHNNCGFIKFTASGSSNAGFGTPDIPFSRITEAHVMMKARQ